ncbi:hypothetical protein TRVL_00716 [Trypanosoma vivax]|nr:hypothetical protein TRVL_00716 [Trypanosoma vivax]
MRGGLGLKVGGGLFGLRIPRQHALSTLSKEEYDIVLHGHPNITNPYRYQLDKHPDLKSVMSNASLDVHVVLLMPRVARVSEAQKALPPSWESLLEHVGGTLSLAMSSMGSGVHFTVHCATLSASVTCRDVCRNALHTSAVSLFDDHMRGSKLRPASDTLLYPLGTNKRIKFFGRSVSECSHSKPWSSVSLADVLPSPSELQGARCKAFCYTNSVPGSYRARRSKNTQVASESVVSALRQQGALELLQKLRELNHAALALCIRLGEVLPAPGATSMSCTGTPELGESQRKLLRSEVDPDEVGVWKRPATTVDALMRWQYFNWDPRAHCADALPHYQRLQPVHLFVDASRVGGGEQCSKLKSDNHKKSVARSLMTTQFSEKLCKMEYMRAGSNNLLDVLMALKRWTVDYQLQAVGITKTKSTQSRVCSSSNAT